MKIERRKEREGRRKRRTDQVVGSLTVDIKYMYIPTEACQHNLLNQL